jgi:hypothetical protein
MEEREKSTIGLGDSLEVVWGTCQGLSESLEAISYDK